MEYCVQVFYKVERAWFDEYPCETIVEAVNYFLNARCEYPETEFRIIHIMEAE